MLSAHLVIVDKEQPFGNMSLPNYNGELLNLAHDLGSRLLTAYDKDKSDIPYPRVKYLKSEQH